MMIGSTGHHRHVLPCDVYARNPLACDGYLQAKEKHRELTLTAGHYRIVLDTIA